MTNPTTSQEPSTEPAELIIRLRNVFRAIADRANGKKFSDNYVGHKITSESRLDMLRMAQVGIQLVDSEVAQVKDIPWTPRKRRQPKPPGS